VGLHGDSLLILSGLPGLSRKPLPLGMGYVTNQGRYTKRGVGTPRRGDVVWFYSPDKGRIGHVGIVEKVEGGRVYTIEGNIRTSTASQGGQVARNNYPLDYNLIDGYGRPPYDIVAGVNLALLGARLLKNGCKGQDVRILQERINSHGHSCGAVDGIFGTNTTKGVKSFQKAQKLVVDGIFGPKSLTALKKLEGSN
jgi:surface antigen